MRTALNLAHLCSSAAKDLSRVPGELCEEIENPRRRQRPTNFTLELEAHPREGPSEAGSGKRKASETR
ncbi:hypothetical protein CHARACLAT_004195 [Characodon lateralis]|uniref:Uncharacterized protein n=1 Tax=Characodon lateralis TaxID=208331 RepID=A0ABU7F1F2_9TELE|nr:hypothetical protein [Characodon lateralis]